MSTKNMQNLLDHLLSTFVPPNVAFSSKKALKFCIELAIEAGTYAKEQRVLLSNSDLRMETKTGPTDFVTLIDKRNNEKITGSLVAEFGKVARVIGEESQLAIVDDLSNGIVFFTCTLL